MEYRILGPLQVVGADAPIPIPAGKTRALLQLLLLSANEVVPTGRLVDGLWGDDPPPSAEHAIEVYVSHLRRALGPDTISTGPGGYAIHLGADELDLDRFERLTAEARIARDQHDPAKAIGLLRRAEGLWRGSALAELPPTPTARAQVVRLEELRIAATEQRVDAMLATGNHRELIPELESLVAAHPYRERLRAQQMLALYRAGRQADALAAFHQARTILGDQLGLEPGEELQALQLAVLRQDTSLGGVATVPRGCAPWRRLAAVRGAMVLVVAAVIAAVLIPVGLIWSTASRPNETAPMRGTSACSGELPNAIGKDDCRPASVAEGSLGGVTSLHCNLPVNAEADEVWFDRFETQAALRPRSAASLPMSGRRPKTVRTARGRRSSRGVCSMSTKGTVLCHANDGGASFVWTYESERLLARAAVVRMGISPRLRWWDATARFLREGGRAEGVLTVARRGRRSLAHHRQRLELPPPDLRTRSIADRRSTSGRRTAPRRTLQPNRTASAGSRRGSAGAAGSSGHARAGRRSARALADHVGIGIAVLHGIFASGVTAGGPRIAPEEFIVGGRVGVMMVPASNRSHSHPRQGICVASSTRHRILRMCASTGLSSIPQSATWSATSCMNLRRSRRSA